MMLERKIPQDGDAMDLKPYLVLAREDRKAKNGQPFLQLKLRGLDHAELDAKIWGGEAHLFDLFVPGQIVDLAGTLDNFNGKVSLIVKRGVASTTGPEQFEQRTHLDVDALWTALKARVDAMSEPLTRHVSQAIMARPGFEAAYKRAPAASKIHNAWVGGLIEHVSSLCALADGVIAHYRQFYDLPVSADKVIFGLLFHDAGKIKEYDLDTPTFEVTAFGRFAPHIVLGPAWVYFEAKGFPDPRKVPDFELEVAHLMHILAAHHGREEWGSPVKPASLEAVIVHHLDNLDAKVLHARDYVLGKPGPTAGFSAQSWVEKTCFFQPADLARRALIQDPGLSPALE